MGTTVWLPLFLLFVFSYTQARSGRQKRPFFGGPYSISVIYAHPEKKLKYAS